ncbi:MAG: hypothetical protein H7A23_22900 [Leptospiraceae bacterium]|nr:hypothetical protein [Leptospiraceae bacterium]MCP5497414.1 hypothetical protein [Leptospiraceae bacterium]
MDLQSCRDCFQAKEPELPVGSNNAEIVFLSVDPYGEEIDLLPNSLYSRYISNVMLYFPMEYTYYFTKLKFCAGGEPTVCVKKWKKKELSFLKPRILIVIGDLSFREMIDDSFSMEEYSFAIQNNFTFMGGNFCLLILPSPYFVYKEKKELAYFNKKLAELQSSFYKL